MEQYTYQRIDLEGVSIRLIRLLMGSYSDAIECELFEGWANPSEGGIPYEALSYTWGSSRKLAEISVDGRKMYVTSNLRSALEHLRLPNEDRILWVDAICINQSDNQEKTHQVRQMGRIYRDAERVLVWLGDGTDETDYMMDSMKLWHDYIITRGDDWRSCDQFWMLHQLHFENEGEEPKGYKGMTEMLQRSWFRRVWILQEIGNARVAIIVCGTKSVSARTFSQVPALIGINPDSHCQAVLDIMPGRSRKESWWGQKRELSMLMSKFRASEATDTRDHIYALLGLSSDSHKSTLLIPDYSKDEQRVVVDTASFLLSCTGQNDGRLEQFKSWTLNELLWHVDSITDSGYLIDASKLGKESEVRLLLEKKQIRVDIQDDGGRTPLHWATINGHETIIRLLIEYGTKLQQEVNFEKRNDHITRARSFNVETWIDTRDATGRASVHWAAVKRHTSIFHILVESNPKTILKDENKRTPLHEAASFGDEAIARLLVRNNIKYYGFSWLGDKERRTPLHEAVRSGNENIVKLLIDTAAEVDGRDKEERTPLHEAARFDQSAPVSFLAENHGGRKILYSKDINGETPLSLAVRYGHEACVRLLVNWKNEIGETLLHLAAEYGDEASVKLLIEKGANLNLKNNEGKTPLHFALLNELEPNAQLLIQHGANIELADDKGQTPLHLAAEYGDEASVKLLIEKGANLNVKNNKGKTPLHLAVLQESEIQVQLLIQHGANIELTDDKGQTPLHLAAGFWNKASLQLLIEEGANLDIKNIKGETPLHLAVLRRRGITLRLRQLSYNVELSDDERRTLLDLLAKHEEEASVQPGIEKGANLFFDSTEGETPLHLVALRRRGITLRLLRQLRANVELSDDEGRTLLDLLAKYEDEASVQLLIEKGANLNVKNNEGKTPLHLAVLQGSETQVQLLIHHGANIEVADDEGRTPQDLAIKSKNECIKDLLLRHEVKVH